MSRKIWLLTAILGLGGCRIVSQQELAELKSPPNPHMTSVAQIWKTTLVPQLVHDARPLPELMAALHSASNFDDACKNLGYRSSDENPCIFYISVQGTVSSLDTRSRSGKMTLREDSGDRVVVQIGPTLRGTLLRDGFKGISYQDFNDQVLFGEYGRAINDQAVNAIQAARLKEGESRLIYGVFSAWDIPQTVPEITPVKIAQREAAK